MADPFRIDCIGDSITSGVEPPSYPRILKSLFHDDGMDHVQINNRGKEGFTVGEYLAFQMSEPNASMLDKRNTDAVIVLLGTNDTRDTMNTTLNVFEKKYRELLSILKEKTDQIFLMNIPLYYSPVQLFWQGTHHTFDAVERITEELNPVIESIAAEMDLSIIDIHEPLKEAGESAFIDGIHPNKKGNKIIAHTCYQTVKTIVNK